MSIFFRKYSERFLKPSINTKLDFTNQLNDKIEQFYPFNEFCGYRIFDAFSGKSFIAPSLDFSWDFSYPYNSLSRTSPTTDFPIKIPSLKNFTWVISIKRSDSASMSRRTFTYRSETFLTYGGGTISFSLYGVTFETSSVSYTFSNNQIYNIAVVYSGSKMKIFVNQEKVLETTATGTPSYLNNGDFCFSGSSWAFNTVGTYYYVGTFARAWNDGEVKSFQDNPWQIFQHSKKIYAYPKPITQISMGSTYGSATIDFGNAPGRTEAELKITGQTSIGTNSKLSAWKAAEETNNHSLMDTIVSDFDVYCSAPRAGDGFTIYAKSNIGRLTGRYKIYWVWK